MKEEDAGECCDCGAGDDPQVRGVQVFAEGLAVDDMEDPASLPSDGSVECGAEADGDPEYEDGDCGSDAVVGDGECDVSLMDAEEEHSGDGQREAQTSVDGEVEVKTLGSEDGLADEVIDGSFLWRA